MNTLALIDLAAKSVAVLTIGFLAQWLWRGASAAQRSILWLAVFSALAALPLTLLMEPRWWLGAQQAAAEAPVSTTRYLVLDAVAAPESIASEAATPVAARRDLPRVTVTQALAALWLAGVAAVMAYRWLGSWRIRSLLANSGAASANLQRQVNELAAALRIRRRIRVRSGASTKVPVTWGTWRPVVLLPVDAAGWPPEELTAALMHELAHIRHHDAAARWLAACVCALHWPNVLIWLAGRKWRLAQEQAADDAVLRRGACPQTYAEQLLRAVRCLSADRGVKAPVLAMARPSTLETRLLAIVEPQRNRRGAGAKTFGGAVVMMTVLVVGLASLSLRAQTGKPPTLPESPATLENAASDAPLIAIEMKFFEVSAAAIPEELRDLFGKALNDAKVNSILRALIQMGQGKLISYPRMVTLDQREVVMKSVVNMPVPGVEPVDIGTKATVLPALRGDMIELSVEIDISKSVGEANGAPIVSSNSITTTLPLPNGGTAIYRLPEAGKAGEGGGAAADVICLIRVERLDRGTLAFSRVITSSIVIPRMHFTDATLGDALEFLRIKGGRDKKVANIVALGPEPKVQINLDLKDVSLHDALHQVAEASGMDLHYSANAAVLAPKGKPLKGFGWQQKDGKESAAVAAGTLIYPRMNLDRALLIDALGFVREEIRRHSPEGESFDVILRSGEKVGMNKVSLELCNTSFLDLLHHIATLSGCALTAEGNALVLAPVE